MNLIVNNIVNFSLYLLLKADIFIYFHVEIYVETENEKVDIIFLVISCSYCTYLNSYVISILNDLLHI